MIPAPFEYRRPADAAAALELLARHGDAAVLLAGGCSLIPMMKLRFARPEYVVDIRALPEWRGVASIADSCDASVCGGEMEELGRV